MNFGYLIGEPGVGKSTLMAAATLGLDRAEVGKPFYHTILAGKVIELGRRRGTFSGTDALSMSVQPKVLEWLAASEMDVIGEGDRLCTDSFFRTADGLTALHIVLLEGPPELAAERRAERAEKLGVKAQDETWVSGRKTKVHRIAESWIVTRISATLSVEEQVLQLLQVPGFDKLAVGRELP